MHDLSHPPFCTSHASMSQPSRLLFVSSLKLQSLSLSLSLAPLLQSKHPMHSNLHNPYTTKNYKHQIHPTLHTIPKWILVLARGRFLQISVLKSLPKTTPQKKFSPETQYSCLLQGDGPISWDLNAATHSQKTKQTKRKKSPTKRSSRNPSIRVVVYNLWMHIWITQTSKKVKWGWWF